MRGDHGAATLAPPGLTAWLYPRGRSKAFAWAGRCSARLGEIASVPRVVRGKDNLRAVCCSAFLRTGRPVTGYSVRAMRKV